MIQKAKKNIQSILSQAIGHADTHQAVIVSDKQSELSIFLAEAYEKCLPEAKFINFDSTPPQVILQILQSLKPLDLVVLIQSTSFRLEAFRVRVELFNRGLKVIEHPHLSSIKGIEIEYYVDSLDYDGGYYRGVGTVLKHKLDQAKHARVLSPAGELVFESGFEETKLNIGDYRQMKNIGGQFPIGEVFTEAKDLEAVNGLVSLFAFGDRQFLVDKPDKPIKLQVIKGKVAGVLDSTPEFEAVLSNIRMDEGEIWVRELGFGLNRAFTKERIVRDIGTYERMCGVHLSLGAKHSLYKKPQFTRKDTKHHVDIFVEVDTVWLDKEKVYQDNRWI